MGLTLVNLILQSKLTAEFANLQTEAVTLIPEVFEPEMYGQTDVDKLVTYFTNNKIEVYPGYPAGDTKPLSVYVAAGDTNSTQEFMGDMQHILAQSGLIDRYEGKMFKKTARVIAVCDHPLISVYLSAICHYYIHRREEEFDAFNMYNLTFTYPEVDFLNKFFPEQFYYRNFVAGFDVIDLIKSGSNQLLAKVDLLDIITI